MKHYKSVYHFQNVNPTCTNVKPSYWRFAGDCSALYHKLSVAWIFLLMSLSHALRQHSVTRTKNFLPTPAPHPHS